MNTPSVIRTLARAGAALAVLSVPALAASYTLTDVGDPEIPSYVTPYLPVINNSGQVAYTLVSTFPDYSGFYYSGGTLTRVPPLFDGHDLPGHDNFAFAINDDGYVVGESRINASSDISHAYVSFQATSSTDISPYPHDDYSSAFAINNSGLVLGANTTPSGPPSPLGDLFLYSIPSGTTTNLTALLPDGALATDLNDLGQVFGFTGGSAFYYDGAVHLMAGVTGSVEDFNNNQQLAVYHDNTAFLYSGGMEINLGSLGSNLATHALNDGGTLVGDYDSGIKVGDFDDTSMRAFVSLDGGIVDLNTLIDPSLGWTLLTANDINENGQITGVGYTPEGTYRPYILTPDRIFPPVPEPGSFACAGALVLGGLALRRRFRRA